MALTPAERQRNFRARRAKAREEARLAEPKMPAPQTAAEARLLLARIGSGELVASGTRVNALKAVLAVERENETRTEGGGAMARFRERPLPTACPHCGQPIDYGSGR